MARTITAGKVAFNQADFFDSGNRKTGVTWADVQLSVFLNGSAVSWPITDGTFVADSSVNSGLVYFNEVVGSSGFYLVRFFPDRIGYWRLVLRHRVLGQESTCEFDVVSASPATSGLVATFQS